MTQAEMKRIGTFDVTEEIIGRFEDNPDPGLFEQRAYAGPTPDLANAWGNAAYQEMPYVSLTLRGEGMILVLRPSAWGRAEGSTYYAIVRPEREPIVLRHFTLTDGDVLETPVTVPPEVAQRVQSFCAFIAGLAGETPPPALQGTGAVCIPMGLLPPILVALSDMADALAAAQEDDPDEQALALRQDTAALLASALVPLSLPRGSLSTADLVGLCREAPDFRALELIEQLVLALDAAAGQAGGDAEVFNEGGECFAARGAGEAFLRATWYPHRDALGRWAGDHAASIVELLDRAVRVLRPATEQRDLYGELAAAHDALAAVRASLQLAQAEAQQD